MKQVYISCPLGVDAGKIAQVARKLSEMDYSSWWYERGTTYDDTKLRISDMFVLMSEHNSFDYRVSNMTAGCKKELELAITLGKPLYLAYWKANKTLNIYPINLKHLEDGRVLGQSGVYLQKQVIINSYEIY